MAKHFEREHTAGDALPPETTPVVPSDITTEQQPAKKSYAEAFGAGTFGVVRKERKEKIGALREARDKYLEAKEATKKAHPSIFDFRNVTRALDRLSGLKSEPTPEEEVTEKKYQDALEEYTKARAQYAGERIWLMIKERSGFVEEQSKGAKNKRKAQKLAAAETDKKTGRGKIKEAEAKARERIAENWAMAKRGWEKLGEMNLEAWGWKPKTRWGKIAARSISARLGVSLMITGGGLILGGGAAGVTLLAGRRLLSGTTSYWGMNDMLQNFRERKATTVDPEKISGIQDYKELAQLMARFEAEAILSGKQLTDYKDYILLRNHFRELTAKERSYIIGTEIKILDTKLTLDLEKSQRGRTVAKAVAIGWGTFVGSGEASKLAREAAQEIGEGVHSVKEWLQHLLGARTAEISHPAPTVTAPTPHPAPAPQEANGPADRLKEYGKFQADHFAKEHSEAIAKAPIATVERGGSIWQAGKQLVKEGKITEREFSEAWQNPDSVVKLPNGQVVHISKLGLVHPGDHVQAIRESNGSIRLSVADNLHVGSNEDLARALANEHKPVPRWLEQTLEHKKSGLPSVPHDTAIAPSTEQLPSTPQGGPEFIRALESLKNEGTIRSPFPAEYHHGMSTGDFMNKLIIETGGHRASLEETARLAYWANANKDSVLQNWIATDRVDVVVTGKTIPAPGGDRLVVVKMISLWEKTPWSQGRLIPLSVLRGAAIRP